MGTLWYENSNSTLFAIDPKKRRQLHLRLPAWERVAGIEPAWSAWKAGALPLSYTRAWCIKSATRLRFWQACWHNKSGDFLTSPPIGMCISRRTPGYVGLFFTKQILDWKNRNTEHIIPSVMATPPFVYQEMFPMGEDTLKSISKGSSTSQETLC